MFSTFLKSAAAAMTITLAYGQDRHVNARLVYFEKSNEDPEEIYVSSNGEFIKCPATTSVDALPVSCPVDASGKVIFTGTASASTVLATASVAQSVNEAVFFFLKNPGAGAPYRIMVVDEAFKTLPKGGSFICNLSPKNALVSLGESKYSLAPGKPVYVKSPEKKDGYNMAPLQLQIEGEGAEWTSLKDTMMRFSDSERYFIVAYMQDGKQPAVKIYKQVVREKAPAP